MSGDHALPAAPRRLDAAALRDWPLPAVDGDGDKAARGCVLVVAGSVQIPGAALLAARAALRAGAGRVVIATVAPAALALAVALPEARVIGLPTTPLGGIDPAAVGTLDELADRTDALLVGPGLQDEAASAALAAALLQRFAGIPALLDAGAMGCVGGRPAAAGALLVTPHAGEMAHLTGLTKEAVQADVHGTAVDAAARWNAIVALKGARTVIATPDGRGWQHDCAVPGLAVAGSGDMLAGLVAGLVARGAGLEQAAAWGVVVHALAGARLARRIGRLGYLASELMGEVPALVDGLGVDEGEGAVGRCAG